MKDENTIWPFGEYWRWKYLTTERLKDILVSGVAAGYMLNKWRAECVELAAEIKRRENAGEK